MTQESCSYFVSFVATNKTKGHTFFANAVFELEGRISTLDDVHLLEKMIMERASNTYRPTILSFQLLI